MRSSRTNKGKDADRTSEWSEYVWHGEGGYWYSTRTGPNGEPEYDYHYPQSQTPQQELETPRTPRIDVFATVTSEGSKERYDSHLDSQPPPSDSLSDESPHYQHGKGDTPAEGISYQLPTPQQGSSVDSGSSMAGSGNVVSASTAPYSVHTSTIGGGTSLIQPFQSLSIGIPGHTDYTSASYSSQQLPQGSKHIYRETDSEDFEELDHRYRAVEPNAQKRFWKEGRVFMMLWTEPARSQVVGRDGGTRNGSHFSTTIWGESAYSEIRRFVVVSVGYGNNICVPIQTYSKQATLKHNLPDPQAHAIIYTGTKVPDEKWYYAEDGSVVAENLTKDPIRVISEQKDKEGELHPASRINYSKIYTVENFVRVLNIGMVHKNSMASLLSNSMVNRVDPPQPPKKHPPRASGNSGTSRDHSGSTKTSSHRDKGKDTGRRRK